MADTANWMRDLSDDTRLDAIMMPGSHDAGMSELHHCAPPIGACGKTQTQSLSVGKQLEAGARYFDIRVDYDYKRLVTYHRTDGWGCNGQDLAPILDQLRDFLKAHPRETAILKFSHIRDYGSSHKPAETKRLINDLLNAYPGLLYTNATGSVNLATVTLGQVRGKAILVFDYAEYINTATGRFRYHDGAAAGQNIVVYDVYSDTSDYEEMKTNQLEKWGKYGGTGKGYLFLLSWTLTASTFSPSVEKMAEEANGKLPGVLQTQIKTRGWAKPNIVYIDYVNAVTCSAIIGYNFA